MVYWGTDYANATQPATGNTILHHTQYAVACSLSPGEPIMSSKQCPAVARSNTPKQSHHCSRVFSLDQQQGQAGSPQKISSSSPSAFCSDGGMTWPQDRRTSAIAQSSALATAGPPSHRQHARITRRRPRRLTEPEGRSASPTFSSRWTTCLAPPPQGVRLRQNWTSRSRT